MKTKAGVEKPLAEWTAQEIKDFCEYNRPCPNDDCQLSGVCGTTDVSVWDLSEKSKFTEQEIQDAKNILRIFGCKTENTEISKNNSGDVVLKIVRDFDGTFFLVNEDLFPSLPEDNMFHKITEILGDADA